MTPEGGQNIIHVVLDFTALFYRQCTKPFRTLDERFKKVRKLRSDTGRGDKVRFRPCAFSRLIHVLTSLFD
jgi:hypothetical protein